MGWFLFILAILFALTGIGFFFAANIAKGKTDYGTSYKLIFGSVAIASLVLAPLLFLLGGIRSVPVKSVGVVTSFGKVEGSYRPGLHWTMPWKSVNILDETIQTTTWAGNDCLNIRIGGQQTACLNATIQWQVKDSAAATLFNDYDTHGNVQGQITNAVVVREFESTVNRIMGDYNPIQDVASNGGAGNSQFSTFQSKVQTAMQQEIGSQINVVRVIMPFAKYDPSTQARLNAIQQQYAETAIANQSVITNQAQAKANQAIRNSVNNDPAVLQAQCLNLVQNAIKNSYSLPAGFNCVGNSSPLALSVGGR